MALATLVLLVRLVLARAPVVARRTAGDALGPASTRLGRVFRLCGRSDASPGPALPGRDARRVGLGFFVFFAGTALAAVDGHLFKFPPGEPMRLTFVFKVVVAQDSSVRRRVPRRRGDGGLPALRSTAAVA